MALHALRRRSSKNALQVAPLAHDLRVTAAEREAGAAVIDFNVRADTSLGRSGIWHQQHRAAYRQKPGNNCPGKEPMSCPASQLSHSCIRHCGTSLARAHDIVILFHCTGCATFSIGTIIPIYFPARNLLERIVGMQSQTCI
jgi:hypothetical protein